jgi:hypothetical protein
VRVDEETAYNAAVVHHYVCSDCLAKIEIDDPLVRMYDFPKLEGSRKQVEWAVNIRKNAMKKHGKGKAKLTVDDFKTQTSAAWWIENR